MRQGRFLRPLLISGLILSLLLTISWSPVLSRPPVALAHAFVIGSDPVDGSTINTPPAVVRIFFNTPISSASIAHVYFGIDNQVVDKGHSSVASDNLRELDTPLIAPDQLPQGSYTVRWTALADGDGHTTQGVIGFNVGHSSTGLPGQVILGPSTSNILPQLNLQGLLVIAWEWLVMIALTLWIGILVMERIILEGGRREDEQREWRDRDEGGRGDRRERGERDRVAASSTPTFFARVSKQALPLQWLCLAALFVGEVINLILRATLLTQAYNNSGIDPVTIRQLIIDTTYGHLWLIRMALIVFALGFLWWTTRPAGRYISIANTGSTRTRAQARRAGGRKRSIQFSRLRQQVAQMQESTGEDQEVKEESARQNPFWHIFAWLTLAGLILLTFALAEDITQLAQAHISAVIFDWLFLAAQGIWFGGAAYLGFVLFPLLPIIEPDHHARSLVTLLDRYTPLALGTISVLLVSGLFLAETSLSNVQQLISDPFGRALLVKIAIIALMLLLSGYALFFLRPQLHRQVILLPVVDAEMPARRTRQSAMEESERRFKRTMRLLSYLGAGVLLSAALMSFFAPPIVFPAINYASSARGSNASSTSSTANTQVIQTKQAGNLTVSLQVSPARVDYDNIVIVMMNDSGGNPVTDAQVQIAINMEIMDMGTARATIQGGKPAYVATFSKDETFSMQGLWDIVLKIQRPNQAPVQETFQVTLAQ
jgi:methionine-rich copper-binding protein CopC/putative copper export protein